MPRKSLELLDQNNFFFNINQNSTLNYNIRSVIMEPAFKILMGFRILGGKNWELIPGILLPIYR
jgi:hypothetical protein